MNRISVVGCWALAAFSLSSEVGGVEPAFRDVLRRLTTQRNAAVEQNQPLGDSSHVHEIAIEYAVQLRKSGLDRAVDPEKHRFQPGDQIRVLIQPFSDAYIYVFFEDERGCRRCLLPSDKNSPRLARRDQPVELPTDGTVYEFEAGFTSARLVLVASKELDGDLTTLCEAVCKKVNGPLTPEERTTQVELRLRNERALAVIRNQQSMAVAYHGRLSSQALSRIWAEMEERGAADALLVEPPGSGQASTLAMFITKSHRPARLVVSIPLKSEEAQMVHVPWHPRR
ncbi:MAG TPA: DUF4384 domain-containing protein [Pirellulales bacterium]|nr:DUF4384 domain-containing protein [Pirellulales bacterium]